MTGDQGTRALQDVVTLGRQVAAQLGDWTFDLQWDASGVGRGRISQDLDGRVTVMVTGLDEDAVAPLLDTLLATVDADAGAPTELPPGTARARSGRRQQRPRLHLTARRRPA